MFKNRIYESQKPYQDTKPVFDNFAKCPFWAIEERVGKSKHWNMLSDTYTSYDEALVALASAKFQYPHCEYRIIQVEEVVFKKITITHVT